MLFEPLGASVIVPQIFILQMLPTIDLDNQVRFRAKEVGDIRAKLHLAAKAKSGNLFAAEQ